MPQKGTPITFGAPSNVETRIFCPSTLLGAPSSHGHEEHAAFYFEDLPQLHYMEQMMTQTGSHWLTAVTSSPINGPASEVELQNEINVLIITKRRCDYGFIYF